MSVVLTEATNSYSVGPEIQSTLVTTNYSSLPKTYGLSASTIEWLSKQIKNKIVFLICKLLNS